MKSLKLTKKQLKEIAEREEAYYFTGNVYSYENVIYYLNIIIWKNRDKKDISNYCLELFKNVNYNYINSANDLINNIKSISYDSYEVEQLYYSAGVYGNNGQLHRIRLYKDDSIVAEYYMYY